MKTTFNTAVKAGLFAVALAFAGSSHAAGTPTYTLTDFSSAQHAQDPTLFDFDAKSFGQDGPFILPPTFTATSNGVDHYSMLVFCLQPDMPTAANANYTLGSVIMSAPVLANVNKLFSVGYAGLTSSAGVVDTQKFVSFQLALWELTNDASTVTGLGGDMYDNSGAQYFSATNDDAFTSGAVSGAQTLLTAVYNPAVQGGPSYALYQLNASGSQTMLAAPVPEADTWAMLAAGLGLLGLVSRRKNTKNEKFV